MWSHQPWLTDNNCILLSSYRYNSSMTLLLKHLLHSIYCFGSAFKFNTPHHQRHSSLSMSVTYPHPSDHFDLWIYCHILKRVKCYLMRRSLLDQHIAVRVEQEHTESPVKLDPTVRTDQMAIPFRAKAQRLIVHIHQDAILLQGCFLQ